MARIEENAWRKAHGKKEIPLFPIAIEVVRRIDAPFELQPSINGKCADESLQVRQTLSRPLSRTSRSICGSSLPSCLGGTTWPRRSTISGSDGRVSRSSSRTAAFAFQVRPADEPDGCQAGEDIGQPGLCRGLRSIALGRKLVILRLRSWRTAYGGHVQPHRHGQDERRRSREGSDWAIWAPACPSWPRRLSSWSSHSY
ncbi:hypothetical protein GGE24_003266 [Bradyrhizobium centrosematis]|nr:hypothetical protein [Bradyrhizobium centrosematis]MCS3773954.1 hypothetical protein [Bradyrhizobium centrosematis]